MLLLSESASHILYRYHIHKSAESIFCLQPYRYRHESLICLRGYYDENMAPTFQNYSILCQTNACSPQKETHPPPSNEYWGGCPVLVADRCQDQDLHDLFDQEEEEEDRHCHDYHLRRHWERYSQLSGIALYSTGTCHELDLRVDSIDEELDYWSSENDHGKNRNENADMEVPI